MPKIAKELSALEVGRLTRPGFHAVGGVPGLLMQVTQTGSRSWVLRKMIGGKRRDMGLGGYPARTLAQARDAARETIGRVPKPKPIGPFGISDMCGVYFLIRSGRIVYVGQAANIFDRCSTHAKSKTFDKFSYIPFAPEHLNLMESFYIHCFQPEYNRASTFRDGEKHAPMGAKQAFRILAMACNGVDFREPERGPG